MFGFGKKKKFEKQVDELIGITADIFIAQTNFISTTPDELIELAKADKEVSGYAMGFQVKMISTSQFQEKDHRGILLDSYYNLFGPDDAEEIINFAMRSLQEEDYQAGYSIGINDIVEFLNSKQPPSGLLELLHRRKNDFNGETSGE